MPSPEILKLFKTGTVSDASDHHANWVQNPCKFHAFNTLCDMALHAAEPGRAVPAPQLPLTKTFFRMETLLLAPEKNRTNRTGWDEWGCAQSHSSHWSRLSYSPSKIRTIQCPVLHRFRDVTGLQGIGGGEVSDGAGDFEDAVVGARGEAEAFDGFGEESA